MSEMTRCEIKRIPFEEADKCADEILHLLRPPEMIVATEKSQVGSSFHILVLPIEDQKQSGGERRLGLATMRREDLLELGRKIVQALDPSPENRILETLERIEKKLE